MKRRFQRVLLGLVAELHSYLQSETQIVSLRNEAIENHDES